MKQTITSLIFIAFLMIGKLVMASEIHIDIITEGTGDLAETGKTVSVHYEGQLTDGTVFDASKPRGEAFRFTIGAGQVIPGWEQGVTGMKVGETRKLTIPPELAYGSSGAGDVIPPDATLIFTIELLEVTTPAVLGQATPDELLSAQKDGVIVIDIRREEEWHETGIIAGAYPITAFQSNGGLHPEFRNKFFDTVTDPDVPILLYCRSGSRTTSLGNALIDQLGFTNVTHLTDGINGWQAAGQNTVSYQPE
jgi:rhodanese-related sulfurtransferase